MDQTAKESFAITCIKCNAVGTIADHYSYKTKTGIKPLPKCKKCHNAGKYIKKPTGWFKLDKETQDDIRAQLQDRRIKLKAIAEKHGVPYANLQRWVAKGMHFAVAHIHADSEDSE